MKTPVIVRAHSGKNSLSELACMRIWTSTLCILDIHFACCICWKYLERRWLELKTPTPFEKNTGVSQMCPVSEQAEPGFLFGDHTFHNTYHSFIRRGTPVSLLLFVSFEENPYLCPGTHTGMRLLYSLWGGTGHRGCC